jgi:hypothetical protein
MYKNRFAVAIKHNGKILRENKDLVLIPFGSEFTVLVKNLNSRRAKFTLHIDGTDVLDGQEIIVNGNSEVEMKRFIRNGNMNEGNAFKFIERSKQIEDGPRGIKVDDGVIRVEYWFEKEKPEVKTTIHRHEHWWDTHYYPYRRTFYEYPYNGPFYNGVTTANISGSLSDIKLGAAEAGGGSVEYSSTASTKGIVRSASMGNVQQAMNSAVASNSTFSSNAASAETWSASAQSTPTMDCSAIHNAAEAGITVPGSKVEQSFTTVYGFDAEANSDVIVLRIAGTRGNVEVVAPVTVKTKNICSTCSHTNKHNARFCSQCGTALKLL